MLIKTLQRLEQLHTMDNALIGDRLGSLREPLVARGWIKPVGYLSRVNVECFADSVMEVEVEVDEVAQVYRYPSPERCGLILTRVLVDITRYRFQLDAFFDHLAGLLEIEPRLASRRRCLVLDHLWYLGDIRVGSGHAFAPVFFGRLLKRAPRSELESTLADSAFLAGGVMLALTDPKIEPPNGHQVRAVSDLLIEEGGTERFDLEMLSRILVGLPADPAQEPQEWFDAKNGRLMLKHLEAPVTFKDIQSKIIGIFWKDRDAAPLEWTADVMSRSGSVSPTLDKAMGGKERRELFIETVSRGRFRLRRS